MKYLAELEQKYLKHAIRAKTAENDESTEPLHNNNRALSVARQTKRGEKPPYPKKRFAGQYYNESSSRVRQFIFGPTGRFVVEEEEKANVHGAGQD